MYVYIQFMSRDEDHSGNIRRNTGIFSFFVMHNRSSKNNFSKAFELHPKNFLKNTFFKYLYLYIYILYLIQIKASTLMVTNLL